MIWNNVARILHQCCNGYACNYVVMVFHQCLNYFSTISQYFCTAPQWIANARFNNSVARDYINMYEYTCLYICLNLLWVNILKYISNPFPFQYDSCAEFRQHRFPQYSDLTNSAILHLCFSPISLSLSLLKWQSHKSVGCRHIEYSGIDIQHTNILRAANDSIRNSVNNWSLLRPKPKIKWRPFTKN